MAKIVEESENLKSERIATVQTDHYEYSINVDQLVMVCAKILDEYDHEQRMGGHLLEGFYRDIFTKIRSCEDRK